jgi:CRP-like cAMP-binding protein
MEENLALLQHVPLFSGLSEARLQPLANSARFLVFPQDYAIVEQGQRIEEAQDGDSLYVIVDGHVRVVLERAGKEELLNRLGPGDFFGEMALLDAEPRVASVVAMTPLRTLSIASFNFRALLQSEAAITYKILMSVSQRLRALEQSVL